MIFDRTQNDVNEAIRLREEKIKVFEELTEAEVSILEKGMMTVNTLNRIENKQSELKGAFNSIGYWNIETNNKQWDCTQIFDEVEFQRIVHNTDILRNAFFVYKNTPSTPRVSYYYSDINSLEKILYDLEEMMEYVKDNYLECGTFECGEG